MCVQYCRCIAGYGMAMHHPKKGIPKQYRKQDAIIHTLFYWDLDYNDLVSHTFFGIIINYYYNDLYTCSLVKVVVDG